ncbi:MAG: NUMOD3 domain-containing DNA-binding protein [Halobacteriota archaeon]|jgi:hypothetical protein
MTQFYTYLWLREDGTPYYAGKGSGKRAFQKDRHRQNPPPEERIVVYPAQSEADALETEIVLIWYYGRKDLGTGILRNMTNGGEGYANPSADVRNNISMRMKGNTYMVGVRRTLETREKMGRAQIGNKKCLGRKRTSEEKLCISESHKGKKFTAEHKANLSEAHKGKNTGSRSEETRKRISDAVWQWHHIEVV